MIVIFIWLNITRQQLKNRKINFQVFFGLVWSSRYFNNFSYSNQEMVKHAQYPRDRTVMMVLSLEFSILH